MTYDYIQDLLNFIHHSPSPYHTVQASRDYLDRAGFQIVATAMKNCLPEPDGQPNHEDLTPEELEKLFLMLA